MNTDESRFSVKRAGSKSKFLSIEAKRFVKRAERGAPKKYSGYRIEADENEEDIHGPPIRRSRSKRDTKTSRKSHARNTQTPGDPQRDPVVFFTYAPSS